MNKKAPNTNELINLEWDTKFFGFSIGKIYANGLSVPGLREKLENAVEKNIEFVELFCDTSDEESIYSSERLGFHLGDLRITLIKNLDGNAIENNMHNDLVFKKADREDTYRLKTFSKGLFKHSRYYRYQKFDPEKIDLMFQIWVEKSISGELADELYYLCNETDILAFCSLKYKGSAASIGLFGVNISHQGKGLGSLMLNRVFQLLYKRRITGLDIITPGNNLRALHLYQKNGFHLSKITLCYYQWLEL